MQMPLKIIGLIASLLMSWSTLAADYELGKDYIKVDGFTEAHSPVLREFFAYNCPHCYRFDHTIADAVKQLDGAISFERTPVGAGRKPWQMSQLAYYIAQKFKLTEQSHGAIFHQVQQVAPFATEADVRQFFIAQGLKDEDLDQALSSSDRRLAIMNYDTQAELSGIRGVPSLLVNGKYLVNYQGRSSTELAALVRYVSSL